MRFCGDSVLLHKPGLQLTRSLAQVSMNLGQSSYLVVGLVLLKQGLHSTHYINEAGSELILLLPAGSQVLDLQVCAALLLTWVVLCACACVYTYICKHVCIYTNIHI